MGPRDDAVGLLVELGAEDVDHLGSDLLTHLLGTERILLSWRAPHPIVLAGLCHAAYGTAGFPLSLLDLADRPRLADVIGAEAEAAVYLYCSCTRDGWQQQLRQPVVTFEDRFTGERFPLDPAGLRSLALITAANELDLTRRGVFDDATRTSIAGLIDDLAPYAPSIAAAAAEVRP